MDVVLDSTTNFLHQPTSILNARLPFLVLCVRSDGRCPTCAGRIHFDDDGNVIDENNPVNDMPGAIQMVRCAVAFAALGLGRWCLLACTRGDRTYESMKLARRGV